MDKEGLRLRLDGYDKWIKASKEETPCSLLDLLVNEYRSGNQQQTNHDALLGSFSSVLFSTHSAVLEAILEGNISQKYFTDPSTRSVLDFLSAESAAHRVRPGIYCNAIGSANTGEFLTIEELENTLRLMKIYLDGTDDDQIKKIDNAMSRQYKLGKRRYIENNRAACQIRIFINATKARIAVIARSLDPRSPLPLSILEFGYGVDVENRLAAHRRHESSNYIMNLFQTCCQILFPGKYRLHQYVVFLCSTPDQTSTAEVLFHLLGQGYISNGCGFSHWPAGLSSHHAYKLRSSMWCSFARWNMEHTPRQSNVDAFKIAMKIRADEDAERERRLLEQIGKIERLGEKALAPKLIQAVEHTERLARSLPDLVARFTDMFLGVRGQDH